MNFVPCITWVKRGIAKETPDKVSLNNDELKLIIEGARHENRLDDDDDEDVVNEPSSSGNNADIEDDDDEENVETKYGLDTYDEEDEDVDETAASLAGLTVFASNENDPYLDQNAPDDSDEEDDFHILPNDNLIAVGHVENETCVLEIYVYNEEQDSLYVHHDIILPAFPMSLEWLDFDPTEENPVNYIAVGDMTPVIQVWDLDLVDTLEPAYKLGKKVKTKKKKKSKQKLEPSEHHGHSDSVLDIKWNKSARFVLASGSVDHTVCLWDLNKGVPVTTLKHHKDKVQSIAWHPCEMQTLLTSSCDRSIFGYDCRSPEENFKTWVTEGEIETILWNHFDPYYFLASTDQGFVYCYDFRTDQTVFTLKAHSEAITAMSLSPRCEGCLTTVSVDKSVKVWDIKGQKPQFVLEKDFKLGSLFTVANCPEAPCTIACGGDNQSNNFKVMDLRESKAFCQHFAERLNRSSRSSFKQEAGVSEQQGSAPMDAEMEDNAG